MPIKIHNSELKKMTTRSSLSRREGSSHPVPRQRAPHRRGLDSLTAFLAFALLFGAACCIHVRAQTSYGTVVGTVTDATGAHVVGAKVALKNNGTDAIEKATSGNGGTFNFINLNPGSYSVTV